MRDRQKKAPALGRDTGDKAEKLDNKSLEKNSIIVKCFRKAIKDTAHEAETVIDGIVTMKLYYEAGEMLRHTVTVTKKYRKAVTT